MKEDRLRSATEVKKRKPSIHVLLPSSFGIESPHLRERTFKLGMVARSLATFRVDNLIVYHENPKKPLQFSASLIKDVMEYLNTAPYLRRLMFPIKESLKYAGILPPLSIPIHPESSNLEGINFPHFREGLVIKCGKRSYVEIGIGKPVAVSKKLAEGSKVIVEVRKKDGNYKFKALSKKSADIYSGFKVTIYNGKLNDMSRNYDIAIATSRYGSPIFDVAENLKEDLAKARKVCLAFGSHKLGLYDISKIQSFKLEDAFSYVINFAPSQGVRTIRTEEAITIALSIISFLLRP